VREALKARIKLATEATNVRAYVDAKFGQVANPAIFVMGDLNDGPGEEYFEEQFLFFDLVSNVQVDIFSASRFLNQEDRGARRQGRARNPRPDQRRATAKR